MRDWLALARALDHPPDEAAGPPENGAPSCSDSSESSERPSFEAFDRFGTVPLSGSEASSPFAPGLVGEWQRALAGLDRQHSPDPSIRVGPDVLRSAERFLADHGEAAVALCWSDLQLFGLHAEVGTARVDCAGALLLTRGSPVVLVTDETIRFANGLAYRRAPLPRGVPVVPVWAFSPSR